MHQATRSAEACLPAEIRSISPLTRRLRYVALGAIAIAVAGCGSDPGQTSIEQFGDNSQAAVGIAQTPLDGATIPKYVEALTTLSANRVPGVVAAVSMQEFQQKMLPASFYASRPAPFNAGTYLWGYKVNAQPPSYPSATIESLQNLPTSVVYVNDLQQANGSRPVLAKYLTEDQTIHWADPLGTTAANHCENGPPLAGPCLLPYGGPIPAVPHLHGAEVPSAFDGHPDAWFTPGLAKRGPAFVSSVYVYPNKQDATTLWYHDHALGMTRLNVYSGLAGFYLLRDLRDTGRANNPIGLPAAAYEQELMIADRQFDTNGQLLFPDGTPANNPTGINGPPPNPDLHPFWNPEFFGDVMTVNGKSWPFFRVEPRRYRFRVVNASNARFLQMQLVREAANGQPTATPGPAIWQIGSDGGLLNTPTNLDGAANPNFQHLFLAPAERGDIIIDFAGQAGRKFILSNLQTAVAPFPSGDPPDPNTSGQVMEFRVDLPLQGSDTTFNPASPQRSLRSSPIVNLNPASTGRTPDAKRQLILVEVEGEGGPEMVLLNNSHWDGKRAFTNTPIPGSVSNGKGLQSTENPRIGTTEVWEIANLTEDAHPIHIHLIQFQVLNRQGLNRDDYRTLYDSRFPGGTFNGITYPPGTFIPGFGPPSNYTTPNPAGAFGGNPDFTPFLIAGSTVPPDPSEAGWKDTLKVRPFEVTRIVARWAPQAKAVSAVTPGVNTFSFDPTTGGPGYVWHCHILDHEDNEMMRPYLVRP